MKKTIFILVFGTMAFLASAQKDIYDGFNVGINNQSFLYAGYKNQLFFVSPQTPNINYFLTTNAGTLEKGKEDGHYNLSLPDQFTSEVTITVNRDSSGIKKSMLSFGFMVVEAPQPSLFPLLAGAYGTIKKETILENPELTVVSYHDYLNLDWEQFTVSKFYFTINLGGDLITLTHNDSNLSSKAIDYIKKAEIGSKFYLENIEATGSRGTTRRLVNMIIVVE